MDKHLFLFGGAPPFTFEMAKQFTNLAARHQTPVSILFVERDGWENYMPKYISILNELGIQEFTLLPLPSTPVDKVMTSIKNSAGIVIGGGDTNLYADYIVDTPIGKEIKERYELGIPVAGFSAGALISPELCLISPHDNVEQKTQSRKGLGLISQILLAVHFSQWNDEDHLRKALENFSSQLHFGIDEETCVYLKNGKLEAMEGEGVYCIKNKKLVKIH
ncbi:Type 1 glutamine amidotransferase-like domain-containing protein [Bacillus spongiae]|uniref:Type 1 glutamine amidotransferase-like domain-containing protein n=1 Tax=Bacillus spongiae TaxID=2683610 RepID=A0ABU8HC66_9BACI